MRYFIVEYGKRVVINEYIETTSVKFYVERSVYKYCEIFTVDIYKYSEDVSYCRLCAINFGLQEIYATKLYAWKL